MRRFPRDPDSKAEGYRRGPTASAPCFSPLSEPAQSKPRWTHSILLETLNAKVLGSTAEETLDSETVRFLRITACRQQLKGGLSFQRQSSFL